MIFKIHCRQVSMFVVPPTHGPTSTKAQRIWMLAGRKFPEIPRLPTVESNVLDQRPGQPAISAS